MSQQICQYTTSGCLWSEIQKPANQYHDVGNKYTIDLKLMAKKTLKFPKPEEHPPVINELHKQLSAAMQSHGNATISLTLKTDGLNLFNAIVNKDVFPVTWQ